MFLFWSTARFICIYYYIALSQFLNALKIIAFSFILYHSPWLLFSLHRIAFHFISYLVLYCFFLYSALLFFLAFDFQSKYGYKFNKTESDLKSAIYGQVSRPDSYLLLHRRQWVMHHSLCVPDAIFYRCGNGTCVAFEMQTTVRASRFIQHQT